MTFIKTAFEKSGARTHYRFAQMLGVSIQAVQYIFGVTARHQTRKSMNLKLLCRLRKVSTLSWTQFGRLLDKEFGEE
ncbi:hypothetical protein UFOVP1625_6 [uncultured Caudovirales phage]|uniref:Uncharacterized protein n=1 Tax=uncultured Caudovirales phage TaxID=2100421 RepID=A0A6J5SY05_9CAUD|nr:hypothetical protein UFOVP1625_6 [uncultured Caudovirales phage]